LIGADSPGLMPHETVGRIALPSIVTVASYVALASARSIEYPNGASGVAAKYASVVSSAAMMPLVAPDSIAMLHSVMRSSIVSARMAEPVYSST
jgi:hypothetical protein